MTTTNSPQLVDIGCNLAHRAFREDHDAVVSRAAEAGVGTIVITGTDLRASREASWIARAQGGRLYSTAGVHPHQAKSCEDGVIEALRSLAAAREVVAIGECGLDFDRNFSPPATQEKWFEAQLELAGELKKPVFLHERAAAERFGFLVKKHRSDLVGAVVHCFTSDAAALDRYLGMDLHIGITGWICDDRRGGLLRDLVRRVPLDRLMLESDAPFLLPPELRKTTKRNEPGFLPHVLQSVAEARRESPEEVAAATTANARAFFRLP
jgi:TatD DNase family protein